MSDPIEIFQAKKEALRQAKEWANLIGDHFVGGGGGVGHIKNFHATVEVYHQAYNGATNYHKAPEGLAEAINQELQARGYGIIQEVIKKMNEALPRYAKEAHEFAQGLLAEAEGAQP